MPKFDIDQNSFNRSCDHPTCGGNCQDCFFLSLRDNAMGGWNDAHKAIFGWNKIEEVGGPPYHILAKMPDHSFVLKNYPERAEVQAFTDQRPVPVDTCCGSVEAMTRVTMYFQYQTAKGNGGRRKVLWARANSSGLYFSTQWHTVHEMGHAMGFVHPMGGSFDTVLRTTSFFVWPQLSDGQALACQYGPIYSCCQ